MKKYDEKIVSLLDKVFQIIRHIQWESNVKTGISPLMAQIMNFIKESPEDKRTPAKVAEELGVKRSTITDSLKVLIKKVYVKEMVNEEDKRYKILYLTEKGKKFLKDINLNYKKILENSVKSMKEKDKKIFFSLLIKFIADLNKRGILPIAKICLNCENFEGNKFKGTKKPHYCKILKKRMSDFDLNVNCRRNVKRRELCIMV